MLMVRNDFIGNTARRTSRRSQFMWSISIDIIKDNTGFPNFVVGIHHRSVF